MKIYDNKILEQYWNEEKNSEKNMSKYKITHGSSKPAIWNCVKCKCEFKKSPNRFYTNLKRNQDPCPHCSGKIVRKNESFLFRYKDIINEIWNYDENIKLGLEPEKIHFKSNKQAYFKCKKHNKSYLQVISDFTEGHNGCKLCNHREADVYNSLLKNYPDIALAINKEEYEKRYNEKLDIEKITQNSNRYYPINCEICGEIHFQKISDRIRLISGCSKFNAINQDSVPQMIIYNCIKQSIGELEYKVKRDGREFDIFSSEFNFAIEYDGYWHNNEKSRTIDREKNEYCIDRKIYLIRVREEKAGKIDGRGIEIINCKFDSDYKYIKGVILNIKNKLEEKYGLKIINVDIDSIIEEAQNNVLNNFFDSNSLYIKCPAIFKSLTLESQKIAPKIKYKSSRIKLEYVCICGEHIIRTPKQLVNTKCRCKKCRHMIKDITSKNIEHIPWMCKVSPEKSLLYKYPKIAQYYSDRNILKSNEISACSHYNAYFNCEFCKNDYYAVVKEQVKNNCKCKKCGKNII